MNQHNTFRVERTTPRVARVIFANPPVNLVVPTSIGRLHDIISGFEKDPHIGVVVFASESPDFFINHFDGTAAGDVPVPAHADDTPVWTDAVIRLSKAPFVSIAAIRGRTRGAGNELALACDLRYASREKAFFSQPEVGIGLVPGGGGTERLPRAIGRDRAFEAILGSADYDADVAERWGWVTRTLPDDQLDAFVDAMAARLATFDREAVATAKAMVNRATLPPDSDLVRAYHDFSDSLKQPGFLERATVLGKMAAERGIDVEYKLGEYLGMLGQVHGDRSAT
jgi:enoyl-CoA hydratase/carnithine racemase